MIKKKTTKENPVSIPSNCTSPSDPVRIITESGSSGLEAYASAIANQGQVIPELTLNEWFKKSDVINLLKVSNVLISGEVGFVEIVRQRLESLGISQIVHSAKDLKSSETKGPLLLLPLVESRSELNNMLALALNTGNPVWLVSPPSQVEKHLLLFFQIFILSRFPEDEFQILVEVIPLGQNVVSDLKGHKSMGIAAFSHTIKAPSVGHICYLKLGEA